MLILTTMKKENWIWNQIEQDKVINPILRMGRCHVIRAGGILIIVSTKNFDKLIALFPHINLI